MTEAEAKTKWCPHVRVRFASGESGNRIDQDFKKWSQGADREFMERQELNCRCIASDCMAWRQIGTRDERGLHKGYCGLAGRP